MNEKCNDLTSIIRTYTTIILSVKLVKSKKYVKYPTKTKITTYTQFNKGSIIVCDIQNNVLIKKWIVKCFLLVRMYL